MFHICSQYSPLERSEQNLPMRARFKNRFARPCVKVVTELGHGLPHLICYAELNETSLSVTMGPVTSSRKRTLQDQ
jgi:hypothetical protein